MPNPQSPDTVIPPLVGKDFHGEFSAKDIAQIIRTGSVIGKAPIVSMPHWGTILSDQSRIDPSERRGDREVPGTVVTPVTGA